MLMIIHQGLIACSIIFESVKMSKTNFGQFHFSLRQPQQISKTSSPYSTTTTSNGNLPNGNLEQQTITTATTTTKHSMLDKLKLFNKEKSEKSKSQISKRTSSSSGFSSARSERSDSSLSLNDTQTVGGSKLGVNSGSSGGGKIKKSDTIKSSKTNKLLSTTTPPMTTTVNSTVAAKQNKTDKKLEKGSKSSSSTTSKGVTVEYQGDIKLLNKTQQQQHKSILKCESKLKPLSGSRNKLDSSSNSGSKNSLIQPPKTLVQPQPVQQQQQSMINSTSIPKPMAAIKGTSKVAKTSEQLEFLKVDKTGLSAGGIGATGISNQLDISSSASSSSDQRTNIVVPMTIGQQQQQNSNISINMSDSIHSNSTHSASTGINSNSSESSVIYRPSSESGSDIMHTRSGGNTAVQGLGTGTTASGGGSLMVKNPIPNRKIEHFQIQETGGLILSEFNNKFNTVPSTKLINNTIYEEDQQHLHHHPHQQQHLRHHPHHQQQSSNNSKQQQQMTILPMRPLLRGYTSHVTLPTRGLRGQHMIADYCDDIGGQGYCSDGDALRKLPARYSSDIDNGYLSEGGFYRDGKNYLSILQGRTLLPTTIEER